MGQTESLGIGAEAVGGSVSPALSKSNIRCDESFSMKLLVRGEAAVGKSALMARLQGLGRAARLNTPLLPRRAREAAVA